MKYEPKIACVLGLGASGAAAARMLRGEGTEVVVVDSDDSPVLRQRREKLQTLGVEVRLDQAGLDVGSVDLIVVSPGIPPGSPIYKNAASFGVPMVSELELGWSRRSCPVLAVTGSNGKSTAVKAAAHILNEHGVQARVCGNYGPPVCEQVSKPADWLVMEVSSFQLEAVKAFRPDVGLLLNLLPNHLDRHGTMEQYGRTKSRLFARTGPGDLCLVHQPWLERVQSWSGGRGEWMSVGDGGDVCWREGRVIVGGDAVADVRGTWFDSDTVGPTVAAVLRAVNKCGVSYAQAEDALRTFEPLPHRQELVARVDGVTFVNDSKATNLAALAAAVRKPSGPVRLMAGGVAKERDFSGVKDLLAERVSAVYLMGQSSQAMAAAWSAGVSCVRCETLEQAFECAVQDAERGDTVLLSPGCTSFDQFRNFEERGKRFVELVEELAAPVQRS